jgi:hypothetical protein
MTSKIIVFLFITSLAVSSSYSQQRQKRKYVAAPAENIFLAIASQPECPLKIENARMLLSIEGNRPIYQYRLINRGPRPIHYFTVVAWYSGGTGGTLSNPAPWDGRITKRLLMPGHIAPDKRDQDIEVVPLTAELRTKLGLSDSMKVVAVLLVDHVTFADASTYDNRKASQALGDFFEKFDP